MSGGLPARSVGAAAVLVLLAGCTGSLRDADSAPVGSSAVTTAAVSQSVSSGVSGPVVHVVDGDTLDVTVDGGRERVRVLGIDTPERDECGYAAASGAAAGLLDGATVGLTADPTQDDRDRYGRVLRYVTLPDGSDLGNALVAGGFAREYTYDRAYARQDAYRAAQADASAGGRGLWSADTCSGLVGATSGAPRSTAPTAAPSTSGVTAGLPSADCAIKGNISGNGRIYHLPGSRDYERTGIDESRGERWFCSVDEAEAAGWRAPNSG